MRASRATWFGVLCLAALVVALAVASLAPGDYLGLAAGDVETHQTETPDEPAVQEPASVIPTPPAASPNGAAVEPKVPVEPTPVPSSGPAWRAQTTATYLVLGLDRRSGQDPGRADAIMIAQADFESGRASLLSIPRDLLVTIPGYGSNRINAAYVYGEVDRRAGGGPALMQETIEHNFGIAVDHYAVLDFQCFRTVVDGIGGIMVDVPGRIVDPYYPTEDYMHRTLVFEAGLQRMDGARALEYVRTRATTSDFGRMHRQQQLIAAIRERALSVDALTAIPSIFSECRGLRTDLSLADQISLAVIAMEIPSDEISQQVIEPPMVVDVITPRGASVLQPRWDLIRPLVQRTFLGSGRGGS